MIRKDIPRIMIAGTASGCGKTTAACGILSLLDRQKKNPAAFKCGPDYIDPMFHTSVIGVESTNLDPFFCEPKGLRRIFAENAPDNEGISLIEGVMGYYDGTGADGTMNSTYSVADVTDTPVILVVNGKGAAASVLATIKGFLEFVPESHIVGAIINNVSAMTYEHIKKLAKVHLSDSIELVGYIPRLSEDCLLESRHLGLVTAAEVDELKAKLHKIADIIENTIDIFSIIRLAKEASPVEYEPLNVPKLPTIRIAVARDKAFCFYYKDNIELLRKMGAEIVEFSPLADEPVPDDIDALYIGGGYPELYADMLEANFCAKESIVKAISQGIPTIAECGGFMYLGRALDNKKMCAAMKHDSHKTDKLVRFGYVRLRAKTDGLFGAEGSELSGHEFHYWDSTDNGENFEAKKTNGRSYLCAYHTPTLYAGYPHIYFADDTDAAIEFYTKCLTYKKEKKHDNS